MLPLLLQDVFCAAYPGFQGHYELILEPLNITLVCLPQKVRSAVYQSNYCCFVGPAS